METKKKKTVTLPELIEECGGPSEFGRQYGFDRASTSQWKLLKCLPSAEKMALIVKKSNGRCSYKSMIETFINGGN